MKVVRLSKEQCGLVEQAIRTCISTLQYEREQAVMHSCNGSAYDKAIQTMMELKQLFA